MSLESCGVCFENLDDTKPLACGHRIHDKCLEKHFKPECPVCKRPQTRVIPRGITPRSSPGRTIRPTSPTSGQERVIIKTANGTPQDIAFVENILTRKHRGERLSPQENKLYVLTIHRLKNITFEIIKL